MCVHSCVRACVCACVHTCVRACVSPESWEKNGNKNYKRHFFHKSGLTSLVIDVQKPDTVDWILSLLSGNVQYANFSAMCFIWTS